MQVGEAAEPMDKPFRRKIRRGADRQYAAALPLQQPFGAVRDAVKSVPNDHEISSARFGDHEALPFAVEKLQAKFSLKCLDLMADRALRDEQLLGSARKTLVPRRGLEGFQGIQRRQPARHARLMRKTGTASKNDALRP